MKIIILIILIMISIISCKKSNYELNTSFNTESAEMVLEIAEKIYKKLEINESEWNDLFNSAGFNNYLIYSDSLYKKQLIKEAIQLCFSENNNSVLDSTLNQKLIFNSDFYKISLFQNIHELKLDLNKAKNYLNNTNFNLILKNADSIAKAYLPERVKDSLPELYPVYLITSNPDGSVYDGAICIDLNLLLKLDTDGVTKLIAHEFHHCYRQLVAKKYEGGVISEINKIHQEGVADLIDKEKPPLVNSNIFPETILQIYNMDYQKTPINLKRLDSLTLGFQRGDISLEEYNLLTKNYFKFGGHTTGYYMSLLIKEHKGLDGLIDTFDDPNKFLQLYNEAAKESKNEYVLSEDFIGYVEWLDMEFYHK